MDINEQILRRTIPVVINSFNQLTYLKNIVSKFKKNSFSNIVILDNDSKYPALLEYYKELTTNNEALVIYYNKNYGPRYFHQSGIYKLLGNIPHLYTDPDLDFEELSPNYVTHALDISIKYKIFKVGSALIIPNESEIKKGLFMKPGDSDVSIPVREWESQFWKNEFENLIFNSPIDTTLHLFNPIFFTQDTPYLIGARISKEGFAVKHLPWYAENIVPEDELNYYKLTGSLYNNY